MLGMAAAEADSVKVWKYASQKAPLPSIHSQFSGLKSGSIRKFRTVQTLNAVRKRSGARKNRSCQMNSGSERNGTYSVAGFRMGDLPFRFTRRERGGSIPSCRAEARAEGVGGSLERLVEVGGRLLVVNDEHGGGQ